MIVKFVHGPLDGVVKEVADTWLDIECVTPNALTPYDPSDAIPKTGTFTTHFYRRTRIKHGGITLFLYQG